MPTPVPVFRVDRPFIFLIRDRGTGCILFMGRICSMPGPAANPDAAP